MRACAGQVLVYLSRDRQKARLKKLAADPATRWRVNRGRTGAIKKYNKLRDVAEHVFRHTDTAEAPWIG